MRCLLRNRISTWLMWFWSTEQSTQRCLEADVAKGLSQYGTAQNLDMVELVERVRAAVVATAAQLLLKEPDTPVDYLVVDLPCTFFMLRTVRCLPSLHALILNQGLKLDLCVNKERECNFRTWYWLQSGFASIASGLQAGTPFGAAEVP